MTKIKKITPKSIISKVVIALVLIIDVYPIFWLLTASVKRNSEWVDYPAYALPKGFYWQNYVEAWTRGHMATFFKNSLIDTLISLIFIVIFSTTVSFACVKMQWKLKKSVARYFQIGIMVPVATSLIPLYQMFVRTKLTNTYFSLIIT
ncbi:MAG: carbohydrate ABC transporter permease, partial [Lachnospiraceae bacterium]|nr:carbohydrate ABC transporter permease [Lachnospiraceae bacterium]